jgi:hypothetical protein
VAFAEHDLGAVEPDGFDAETDLACGWLGEGKLVELKDFGGTGFVEANDLCGFG